MLVLSRKPGEQILIGEGVRLSVVRISGGRVQLGIDAPRDFKVVREEIAPQDDFREKTAFLSESKTT